MKRMVLASFLLLLFAAALLAEGPKYQIYSENRGILGFGGRRVIMLDKETGDSWLYVENKWKPIVKEMTAEGKASQDELRAKMEAEIIALKEKQAVEIQALKDKQEQELGVLRAKLDAGKAAPALTAHKTRPVYAKKKAAEVKPTSEKEEDSGTEAPPAWLSE
ncbi:MAG: hypothetical protein PHG97_05375 [Candidatus Margulisbacteria bacterium]|nr:hypothetical protein [Candidatus Margulisiibacteriota bacterium]